MDKEKHIVDNVDIKAIRRAANIGLYGTLLLSVLTVAEYYLAKYVWIREITSNEYTRHLLLTIGLVVAVLDISMVLLTLRRQIPRLRQLDDRDEKLGKYRQLVRSVYFSTLVVVFVVCAVVILSRENTLIMLLMLLFVMLALNYPNMYKMKTDLGMNDEDMTELFGDQYIKGGSQDE